MRWDFDKTNNDCYLTHDPKIMYVNRYGYIYPDCKTYKTKPICHIKDMSAIKKVKDFYQNDSAFHMITIEFNSFCHANCFYCFQHDGLENKHYEYYDELLNFLAEFETRWIFFSGGEILDQPLSRNFIRKYRKCCPNSWIHLKTNGNASLDKIPFIEECCDSVMVSFNGFTPEIYYTIMQIQVERTKVFCEAIRKNTKTKLGLKFLNSPVAFADVPAFLNWALGLDPQCIVIQTAYNYKFDIDGNSIRTGSTFDDLNLDYWFPIYERISKAVDRILSENYFKINASRNYFTADKEFMSLLRLAPQNVEVFRTDGVYRIE